VKRSIDWLIEYLNEEKDESKAILQLILIIVYFFITEFLSDILAIDTSFVATHIVPEEEDTDNEKSLKSGRRLSDVSHNIKDNPLTNNPINFNASLPNSKIEISNFLIESKEISLHNLIYKKKNGFGSIYLATYKNEQVVCRVVKFDRLTRYELESLSNDIQSLT